MTITRMHGSCIATQWLQILFDYANLSDVSDSSRGISQIAPEEIPISSEESNHKSEEFRHFLGRKSTISTGEFENSSGEIEMSSLSLYYCDASALGKVAVGLVMSLFFRNLPMFLRTD